MSTLREGLQQAVRGRRLLLTALVLVASVVMVRLGIWQLDRLAQRRAFNARVEAQLQAPTLEVNTTVWEAESEQYRYRAARARGRFDLQGQILVRNRFYQNRPGYRVLTPLLLEGQTNVAIVVDRGWLPEPLATVPPPPAGVVTVEGYLMPGEEPPRSAPPPEEGPWYWVDLEALDQRRPYRVLPVYLVQTPPPGETLPTESATGLIRTPRPVELTEGPHLGYAIQWFLFAAALPVVYVYSLGKAIMNQDPTRANGRPEPTEPA